VGEDTDVAQLCGSVSFHKRIETSCDGRVGLISSALGVCGGYYNGWGGGVAKDRVGWSSLYVIQHFEPFWRYNNSNTFHTSLFDRAFTC
jgi:hypothetical protein